MSKHALIECQACHDWSWNIQSLADRNVNFHAKSSAHKMTETLDIGRSKIQQETGMSFKF